MKRLITIILVLISLGSFAQTFKPTVKKITLDSINARTNNVYINDPLVVQDTTLIDLIKFHSGTGSTVNFGTNGQVPVMNLAGSDFQYSDNFKWNDTTLNIEFGTENILIGNSSGINMTTGVYNTFLGSFSGVENNGDNNSFFGRAAGLNNTGNRNTYLGYESGSSNINGSNNLFVGETSGNTNTGSNNTFIGKSSGQDNKGSDNIFIGYYSGSTSVSSSYNIFIGNGSGTSETGSNKLYIENSNSTTPLIYGDFANDTVKINGTLDVTKNFSADTITALEIYNKTKDHGFFAFEDSAVVIDCTQNTWVQVTNATNNIFDGIQEGQGFDISGDTITFNSSAKADLHPHIIIHWGIDGFAGNGEDYEVRIYNIDNTAGIARKAEGTTTGSNNRVEIGSTSYDINSTYGDRYILQIMNKTNSNDFTIENGSIYIEVSHY